MKKILGIIVGILILAVVVTVLVKKRGGNDQSPEDLYTIQRETLRDVISISGKVKPQRQSDLGMNESGVVKEVLIKEGQFVSQGDVLVRLDSDIAQASLAEAEAARAVQIAQRNQSVRGADQDRVALVQAQVTSSQVQFSDSIKQQNILIRGAQEILLSSGLEAVPEDPETEEIAPIVSGIYRGDLEGVYVLDVYASAAPSGFSYLLSGLEEGRFTAITESPSPLGTQGLFVQFVPDQKYDDTRWLVEIPNTRSGSYVANLNALEATKEAAKVALSQAEQSIILRQKELALEQSPVNGEVRQLANAQVNQASVQINSSQIRLNRRVLRAPFSGLITESFVELGEVISPGQTVASLASVDNFEITVNIPEVDIAKLVEGQQAEVVLDAYPEQILGADVVFIKPAETKINDVSYYETILKLHAADAVEVRSGMTASVDLIIKETKDILVVPSKYVETDEDDRKYVFVDAGDMSKKQFITVGQESVGKAEILGGLEEGDVVIPIVSNKRGAKK